LGYFFWFLPLREQSQQHNEVQALRQLRHPNIVAALKSYMSKNILCIEYAFVLHIFFEFSSPIQLAFLIWNKPNAVQGSKAIRFALGGSGVLIPWGSIHGVPPMKSARFLGF
jgi:hypothetical protein